MKGDDRLSFYFRNVHLRAGFILDPVRGTANRWQAATVRPEREKTSEKKKKMREQARKPRSYASPKLCPLNH